MLGGALCWQGRAARFFFLFLPVTTDDTKSHHSCRTERVDVSVKHDQTSVEQTREREKEREPIRTFSRCPADRGSVWSSGEMLKGQLNPSNVDTSC